jgi:histidine triad (HIT) family protein
MLGFVMSDYQEGCVFCQIASHKASAFIVYEDDVSIAFLDLRQVRPGHSMVIPKKHIEHFTDIDEVLSAHLLSVAQQIARKIRDVFCPPRVGYVVAGFGVSHAHLHVQPLWEEHDITSQRYLDTTRSPPVFDVKSLPILSEAEREKTRNLIKI